MSRLGPIAGTRPLLSRVGQFAVGGIVGAGAVIAVAWLGLGTLSGVVPMVAIMTVGLLAGWIAALSAFLVASAIGVVMILAAEGLAFGPSEAIRVLLVLLGVPILIALIRHDEQAYGAVQAARAELEAVADEAREREEELRITQAALRVAYGGAEQERARLTEVADAIPEPLIVYDVDGRGRYGNRAAMRIFGRAFIERPPDEWQRLVEPRDGLGTPLEHQQLPQIHAQVNPLRSRMIVRLPTSGKDLLVDVEATPVPGGGCVVLLRDVGKEEDERRRLSRFASFVAHELRNPLAVAKARVELAQRDGTLSPRSRSHGARALDSIEAAIGILERLELYSRADTGRVEARHEPFNLGAAVETAVERLRARGSERELRIDVPSRTVVVGDRQLAEQAITNLLTNADRYSAPSGAIRIDVEVADQVILRVADDGPGIADEIADGLFRDRVSSGRGLGLGLYLVRATMDAQGGSVQLEQRRPEAVFALRFPVAAIDNGAPPD